MPFTGGQFRVKIETEPSTWFRELQSVTENIYLKSVITGKFGLVFYQNNGVKVYKNQINFFLSCCLLGLSFGQVDYIEIQTIFNSRCINCHSGPDPEKDLSLDSYNNVMNGGDSGDVVIPYDHANSLLWQYINSGFMPPGTNDLTDSQVDLIAQWINEGALPEPNEPMIGDMNDDEVVNVLDVVLLVNSVLNGGSADDYPQADVNGDGTLNVLDVVLLINIILEI